MQPNQSDPTKSSYEALHGPFYFQSIPIALPGMKCLVHIKPNRWQSWGVHAETDCYIGPALKYY